MKFEDLFKGFKKEKVRVHTCGGAFYFFGFIGALIYYLNTATSFWEGLFGIFKALLWPAFLVYELLMFMGA
jgi:hypothetical protein